MAFYARFEGGVLEGTVVEVLEAPRYTTDGSNILLSLEQMYAPSFIAHLRVCPEGVDQFWTYDTATDTWTPPVNPVVSKTETDTGNGNPPPN